jgi:two-component system sensor histidine kinase BaeS
VADLLSRLAHDLRSPLGVVIQALAELRSDFDAQLTADHRLLLALADRGLGRLARIADTITLAAAFESGSMELRRRPIDLVSVVRQAVAATTALEPRREVELSCELPEEPAPCEVDVERVTRAVSEVVHNAVRHARGRVRVRLELLSGEARVVIEDDGGGIRDDQRATLFQRYARRETRSGLGMGLSIAAEVIAGHDGTITLEASTLPPGRPGTVGARFVLSLPLRAGGA